MVVRTFTLRLARFFAVAFPPLAFMLIDRWIMGIFLVATLMGPTIFVQYNIDYRLSQWVFIGLWLVQVRPAWKAVTAEQNKIPPERKPPTLELR